MDCKNTDCRNDMNNNYIQTVCVGYSFVVPQIMGETYEPQAALGNGTMFPELNMPYVTYVPKQENGGCCND